MTADEGLDYRTIRDEVENLCQAVHNKIEREWPATIEATGRLPVMLRALVLVSANTFRTIRFLCADERMDPAQRLEFVVSVPPLTRTLVDTLFTIVFLYDSPEQNLTWYWKAAWGEYSKELARARRDHADDPAWQEWIERLQLIVDNCREWWSIDGSSKDPQPRRWPHPGGMLGHPGLSESRREFLQYLHDWYYSSLSQESHLSGPGLIIRSFTLFEQPENPERGRSLDTLRIGGFFTALIILISILSEIESELSLGLRPRLAYIWGMISPYSAPAKEVYEYRYRSLLNPLAD